MNNTLELIEDIRTGKMVILVDDENRENEGDLIIAAEHISPQFINFMAVEARGLICLALTQERIKSLGVPMMVNKDHNKSPNKTAFTVSIEASCGVSTGISAADRAHTVKVASSPESGPGDVIMPGHIFPIQAESGGVLKRAGHTEAGVDLAALAGLNPAAVICEIMNPDGTMARVPDLKAFAKKHKLKMGSIENLIAYRIEHETFVEQRTCSDFSSEFGSGFKIIIFKNSLDNCEHIALVKGKIYEDKPVLVRMHRESVIGDVFHSLNHQSGKYLKQSMQMIDKQGSGVIVYLRNINASQRLEDEVRSQEGVDFKKKSDSENTSGFLEDNKDYGVGAQILRALGVRKLKLIANHSVTVKKVGLGGYGIEVVEIVSLSQNAAGFAGSDNKYSGTGV